MTLFENLLQVSLTGAGLVAVAMALSLLTGRRLAARYKRLIWLVIAVRLLIPFTLSMPQAPVQVPMPDLRSPIRMAAQAPENESILPAQQPDIALAQTVRLAAPDTMPPSTSSFSWLSALCAVWALGAAIFLLHLALSQRHAARRLRRWSREASTEAHALLIETQGAMSIQRKVSLRRCSEVHSPMLIGALRPVILLPHKDYDREDLALILRHELTHLQSGDIWFKALMLLVRAIHWFNPLVHLMVRQAETDMEFACDDAVVRALGAGQGRRYGETILAAACMVRGRAPALSTHFLSTKKHLARRILNIMQQEKRRIGIAALAAVLVVTMAGGLVVSFASSSHEAAPAETTPIVQAVYDRLFELRPDQYEALSVSAFRDAVYEQMKTDEAAYLGLYDVQNDEALALRYSDEDAGFLFNTLIPLTAETWPSWQFHNAVASPNPPDDPPAAYAFTTEILDADALKVGEYESRLRSFIDEMEQLIAGQLDTPAPDRENLQPIVRQIEQAYSDEMLRFAVESIPDLDQQEATIPQGTDELMRALMALDTSLPLTTYRQQVEALCAEAGTSIYAVLSEAQLFFDDPTHHAAMVSLTNTSSEMFAAEIGGAEEPFASNYVRREKTFSLEEELDSLRDIYSPEELEEIEKSMQDDPRSLAYLVQVNYIILYDILAPDAFTAAQREARLAGVKQEIHSFMDGLSEDELLDAGLAERMETLFGTLAKDYSDDQMRIVPELQQIDGFGWPGSLEITPEA